MKPKMTMKSLVNKSAEKIVGNGYLKNTLQKRKRTRSLSVKYGLSKNKEIVKASGYKLQDFTILAEIIQKSAICKTCKACIELINFIRKTKFL